MRDPALRLAALIEVAEAAGRLGWHPAGSVASPAPGPAGNVEYFLWLRRDADPGEGQLERAVAEGPQGGEDASSPTGTPP